MKSITERIVAVLMNAPSKKLVVWCQDCRYRGEKDKGFIKGEFEQEPVQQWLSSHKGHRLFFQSE